MSTHAQMFSYREILNYELTRRQAKNAKYSLRAFARDITVSPSTLCEVMSGRCGLSVRTAKRIVKSIGFSLQEQELFCDLVQSQHGKTERERKVADIRLIKHRQNQSFSEMHLDTFKLIADWYHSAILELMLMDDFDPDPKWIASTLRISPHTAGQAVERMLRLGILEKVSGGLKNKVGDFIIGRDIPSLPLREFHRQILTKASTALDVQPLEAREFNTAIIAIDSDDIPIAKAMIREFQQEICQKLSDRAKKSRLYTCAIQFFSIDGGGFNA